MVTSAVEMNFDKDLLVLETDTSSAEDKVSAFESLKRLMLHLSENKEDANLFDDDTKMKKYLKVLEQYITASSEPLMLSALSTLEHGFKLFHEKMEESLVLQMGTCCLNVLYDNSDRLSDAHLNIEVPVKLFQCLCQIEESYFNTLFHNKTSHDKVLGAIKKWLEYDIKEKTINDARILAVLRVKLLVLFTKLTIIVEDTLKQDFETWLLLLFPFMFVDEDEVRQQAMEAMKKLLPLVSSSVLRELTCWPNIKDNLKTKYSKQLMKFAEYNKPDWANLWCFVLDILGDELHLKQNNALINCLLEAEEKAFKSICTETRRAAFLSWKHLIDKFIVPNAEDIARRLKLLMQPMIANNAKTDLMSRVKLDVWWHLIMRLAPVMEQHADNVLYHFLHFAFGPLGDTPLLSMMLTDSSVGSIISPLGNRRSSNFAMKPVLLAPGRRFPILHKFCADALAQILTISYENSKIDFILPRFSTPLIVNPAMFLKLSKLFIHSVGECTLILTNPDTTFSQNSFLYLEHNWNSLMKHIVATLGFPRLNECPNDKLIEMVKDLLRLVQNMVEVCTTNPTLAEVCLSPVLECIVMNESSLPTNVLVSTTYHVGTSDVINGTPLLLMVDLFLSPALLTLEAKQPSYLVILKHILKMGIGPVDSTIAFTQAVMKRVNASMDLDSSLSKTKSLANVWCLVARFLASFVGFGRDINQDSPMKPEYTCIYSVLMFPIQHSDISLVAMPEIHTVWAHLFQAFQTNVYSDTPAASSLEMNELCEQLCSKVLQELVKRPNLSCKVLVCLATLVVSAIKLIPFRDLRWNVSDIKSNNTSIQKGSDKSWHGLRNTTLLLQKLFEHLKCSKSTEDDAFIHLSTVLTECLIILVTNVQHLSMASTLCTQLVDDINFVLKIRPAGVSPDIKTFKKQITKLWLEFLKVLTNICCKENYSTLRPILLSVFETILSHPFPHMQNYALNLYKDVFSKVFSEQGAGIPQSLQNALDHCAQMGSEPVPLSDDESETNCKVLCVSSDGVTPVGNQNITEESVSKDKVELSVAGSDKETLPKLPLSLDKNKETETEVTKSLPNDSNSLDMDNGELTESATPLSTLMEVAIRAKSLDTNKGEINEEPAVPATPETISVKSKIPDSNEGNKDDRTTPPSTPKVVVETTETDVNKGTIVKTPPFSTPKEKSSTQKKRLLTPHQREMMRKRRDDIPALYSDLTQESQDMFNSESSQDNSQVTIPERFKNIDKPLSTPTETPTHPFSPLFAGETKSKKSVESVQTTTRTSRRLKGQKDMPPPVTSSKVLETKSLDKSVPLTSSTKQEEKNISRETASRSNLARSKEQNRCIPEHGYTAKPGTSISVRKSRGSSTVRKSHSSKKSVPYPFKSGSSAKKGNLIKPLEDTTISQSVAEFAASTVTIGNVKHKPTNVSLESLSEPSSEEPVAMMDKYTPSTSISELPQSCESVADTVHSDSKMKVSSEHSNTKGSNVSKPGESKELSPVKVVVERLTKIDICEVVKRNQESTSLVESFSPGSNRRKSTNPQKKNMEELKHKGKRKHHKRSKSADSVETNLANMFLTNPENHSLENINKTVTDVKVMFQGNNTEVEKGSMLITCNEKNNIGSDIREVKETSSKLDLSKVEKYTKKDRLESSDNLLSDKTDKMTTLKISKKFKTDTDIAKIDNTSSGNMHASISKTEGAIKEMGKQISTPKFPKESLNLNKPLSRNLFGMTSKCDNDKDSYNETMALNLRIEALNEADRTENNRRSTKDVLECINNNKNNNSNNESKIVQIISPRVSKKKNDAHKMEMCKGPVDDTSLFSKGKVRSDGAEKSEQVTKPKSSRKHHDGTSDAKIPTPKKEHGKHKHNVSVKDDCATDKKRDVDVISATQSEGYSIVHRENKLPKRKSLTSLRTPLKMRTRRSKHIQQTSVLAHFKKVSQHFVKNEGHEKSETSVKLDTSVLSNKEKVTGTNEKVVSKSPKCDGTNLEKGVSSSSKVKSMSEQQTNDSEKVSKAGGLVVMKVTSPLEQTSSNSDTTISISNTVKPNISEAIITTKKDISKTNEPSATVKSGKAIVDSSKKSEKSRTNQTESSSLHRNVGSHKEDILNNKNITSPSMITDEPDFNTDSDMALKTCDTVDDNRCETSVDNDHSPTQSDPNKFAKLDRSLEIEDIIESSQDLSSSFTSSIVRECRITLHKLSWLTEKSTCTSNLVSSPEGDTTMRITKGPCPTSPYKISKVEETNEPSKTHSPVLILDNSNNYDNIPLKSYKEANVSTEHPETNKDPSKSELELDILNAGDESNVLMDDAMGPVKPLKKLEIVESLVDFDNAIDTNNSNTPSDYTKDELLNSESKICDEVKEITDSDNIKDDEDLQTSLKLTQAKPSENKLKKGSRLKRELRNLEIAFKPESGGSVPSQNNIITEFSRLSNDTVELSTRSKADSKLVSRESKSKYIDVPENISSKSLTIKPKLLPKESEESYSNLSKESPNDNLLLVKKRGPISKKVLEESEGNNSSLLTVNSIDDNPSNESVLNTEKISSGTLKKTKKALSQLTKVDTKSTENVANVISEVDEPNEISAEKISSGTLKKTKKTLSQLTKVDTKSSENVANVISEVNEPNELNAEKINSGTLKKTKKSLSQLTKVDTKSTENIADIISEVDKSNELDAETVSSGTLKKTKKTLSQLTKVDTKSTENLANVISEVDEPNELNAEKISSGTLKKTKKSLSQLTKVDTKSTANVANVISEVDEPNELNAEKISSGTLKKTKKTLSQLTKVNTESTENVANVISEVDEPNEVNIVSKNETTMKSKRPKLSKTPKKTVDVVSKIDIYDINLEFPDVQPTLKVEMEEVNHIATQPDKTKCEDVQNLSHTIIEPSTVKSDLKQNKGSTKKTLFKVAREDTQKSVEERLQETEIHSTKMTQVDEDVREVCPENCAPGKLSSETKNQVNKNSVSNKDEHSDIAAEQPKVEPVEKSLKRKLLVHSKKPKKQKLSTEESKLPPSLVEELVSSTQIKSLSKRCKSIVVKKNKLIVDESVGDIDECPKVDGLSAVDTRPEFEERLEVELQEVEKLSDDAQTEDASQDVGKENIMMRVTNIEYGDRPFINEVEPISTLSPDRLPSSGSVLMSCISPSKMKKTRNVRRKMRLTTARAAHLVGLAVGQSNSRLHERMNWCDESELYQEGTLQEADLDSITSRTQSDIASGDLKENCQKEFNVTLHGQVMSPKRAISLPRLLGLGRTSMFLKLNQEMEDTVHTINATGEVQTANWVKYSPVSAGNDPGPSILKRSLIVDETEPESSPTGKRKRLSFKDPEVLQCLTFKRTEPKLHNLRSGHGRFRVVPGFKRRRMMKPRSLSGLSEGQGADDGYMDYESLCESQGSVTDSDFAFLDSKLPVWPSLLQCRNPIENIVNNLTDSMWVKPLLTELDVKGINTVGDLCALDEATIINLPLKTPKITHTKKVLEDYEAYLMAKAQLQNSPQLRSLDMPQPRFLDLPQLRIQDSSQLRPMVSLHTSRVLDLPHSQPLDTSQSRSLDLSPTQALDVPPTQYLSEEELENKVDLLLREPRAVDYLARVLSKSSSSILEHVDPVTLVHQAAKRVGVSRMLTESFNARPDVTVLAQEVSDFFTKDKGAAGILSECLASSSVSDSRTELLQVLKKLSPNKLLTEVISHYGATVVVENLFKLETFHPKLAASLCINSFRPIVDKQFIFKHFAEEELISYSIKKYGVDSIVQQLSLNKLVECVCRKVGDNEESQISALNALVKCFDPSAVNNSLTDKSSTETVNARERRTIPKVLDELTTTLMSRYSNETILNSLPTEGVVQYGLSTLRLIDKIGMCTEAVKSNSAEKIPVSVFKNLLLSVAANMKTKDFTCLCLDTVREHCD